LLTDRFEKLRAKKYRHGYDANILALVTQASGEDNDAKDEDNDPEDNDADM